jgi:hypothetical protein
MTYSKIAENESLSTDLRPPTLQEVAVCFEDALLLPAVTLKLTLAT